MASTRLAEAVGYPGSSVAFAQLLSGMERDGLIAREVRGKRTYRITLSGGSARAAASAGRARKTDGAGAGASAGTGPIPPFDGAGAAAIGADPDAAAAGFDYDELARRLLIQVVRRLAATPTELEQTVAGLERELVSAWTRHGALTAENVRLREQLRETQRHLDLLRQRSPRLEITDELDKTEVVVLERLLERDADTDAEGATAGRQG